MPEILRMFMEIDQDARWASSGLAVKTEDIGQGAWESFREKLKIL